MGLTCAIDGCYNSSKKFKRWQESVCDVHPDKKKVDCGCEQPFTLHAIPTRKKRPVMRNNWRKMINRQVSEDDTTLLSPKKDSRICSIHFIDGKPTEENPLPTLHMGYDGAEERARILLSNIESDDTIIPLRKVPTRSKGYIFWLTFVNIICFLVFKKNVSALLDLYKRLIKEIAELKSEINDLKTKLNEQDSVIKPVYEKFLKDDASCNFYTTLDSLELFHKIHEFIKPYVQKRFVTEIRTTSQAKSNRGRPRKLHSKDEFLLVMMKLRLGCLHHLLGDIFGIGTSTVGDILKSWLRAMSKCLSSFVFCPDEMIVREITPKRFGKYSDTIGIIDCSEIFIETPASLELQAATWSEYKHHNTMKFLISVAPNSLITFISEPYTGRCSDKQITCDSEFLKTIPPQTRIMADKGFPLQNECANESVYFTVPPGKRGASQMTPEEVMKTSDIAKLRIVVEQVIGRLKFFRIIGSEFPNIMLPHLEDILIICAAFCNFRKPFMVDD